jgi:hypothetical protein
MRWSAWTAAVVAASLWCAPTIAQAEPAAAAKAEAKEAQFPIEVGGLFFTRWETRRNYAVVSTAGAEDLFRWRAELIVKTRELEVADGFGLVAVFAPQFGGFFHVGGDDLADPTLGLHQGYVSLLADGFRLDAGRFEMAYGDELVIGPVGWHHIGRAFDGLRAHGEFGKGLPWLDVFVTVLKEGFVEAPDDDDFAAGDEYFLGTYLGLGPVLGDPYQLDFYVLARLAPEAEVTGGGIAETNEVTLGARTTGLAGVFDWRAEAGVQLGKRNDADLLAWQADAELGFGFLEGRAFRVSLEGFIASGDDPTTADAEGWFQLYPTAHKWLGYMDFIGPRTNVAGGVLHVGWSVIPQVRIMVDAHTFFRPEKTAAGLDGYTGTEIDTGILWKPGKILGIRCGYDIFLPDSDVSDELLHFVELELRAQF